MALSAVFMGCAYKLSTNLNNMPGQVKRVQIPLFQNKSIEPQVEVFFTNSLKDEALKSRLVKIENELQEADAVLKGTITNIDVLANDSVVEADKNTEAIYMPRGTILAKEYKVTVDVQLQLRKVSNNEILWSGTFRQFKNYSAPQITLPSLNTSNSLYNQSAKRQTLESLAKEMMQGAFDRMLENF